jgi:hypothetical protein
MHVIWRRDRQQPQHRAHQPRKNPGNVHQRNRMWDGTTPATENFPDAAWHRFCRTMTPWHCR